MFKYINENRVEESDIENSRRLEKLFNDYAVKISGYIHNFIIDIIEHKSDYPITNVAWHKIDTPEGDENNVKFHAVALIDDEHEFLAVTRDGAIFYVAGNFRPETPDTKYDIVSIPYMELTEKLYITDYEANKLARCVDYFDKKLEIL